MDTKELRHAQALAYVWGRRDAGDTRVGSPDFANAYCAFRAEWGERHHITFQDAYRSYVEHGSIVPWWLPED